MSTSTPSTQFRFYDRIANIALRQGSRPGSDTITQGGICRELWSSGTPSWLIGASPLVADHTALTIYDQAT